VAGVVDEVGEGVTDLTVGDRVFGFSDDGAGAAELALLSHYAPIPPSLGFAEAAGLPVALETATRSMDALGVGAGSTLLINGAADGVGSAAVQLAVARGARVLGTASPANHDYLRSLGAAPSPPARASSSGFARSRPTASMWRSTSPGAACCPSLSSWRAAQSTL
jgi:NADPH:quinone reductase-like Zn-dependent oxidoreductase